MNFISTRITIALATAGAVLLGPVAANAANQATDTARSSPVAPAEVTSVNDAEKDYVEYEVVKGRDSFEVQIDFDGSKSRKVDVTTNVWQSDATERALAAAKR